MRLATSAMQLVNMLGSSSRGSESVQTADLSNWSVGTGPM